MDISTVESTSAVCIFGLGIGIFALALYKGGSFIERKLDEAEQLEKEVSTIGNRKQSPSGAFSSSREVRKRA
ncbi:hypothetical protein [Lysinibacillus sp. GbtcB16]|uniref:hypothetical protein n=1 Tax=Lysinibacillus sp. GbtcB16 TaxID=2824761 RepID=UPI001C3019F6|nr:hypothetical protein [Lysinibacillus sp. GbtcB16]